MPEFQPEKWLEENYRARAEQMGVDLEHLATLFDRGDPKVAAWMRSQAAPVPEAAPKARRAPKKADG